MTHSPGIGLIPNSSCTECHSTCSSNSPSVGKPCVQRPSNLMGVQPVVKDICAAVSECLNSGLETFSTLFIDDGNKQPKNMPSPSPPSSLHGFSGYVLLQCLLLVTSSLGPMLHPPEWSNLAQGSTYLSKSAGSLRQSSYEWLGQECSIACPATVTSIVRDSTFPTTTTTLTTFDYNFTTSSFEVNGKPAKITSITSSPKGYWLEWTDD